MILFLLVLAATQLTDSTFTSYKYYSYDESLGIQAAAKERLEYERRLVEGDGGITSRIIGGWTANHQNYPWLAGCLTYKATKFAMCGGSLINPTRVLTAAHCWSASKWKPDTMEVVLGSNMVFYGGQRIITTRVVVHPQWDPLHPQGVYDAVDAALVILPKSVIYKTNIKPIELTGDYLGETFEGWDVWAAGYGLIKQRPKGVFPKSNQAVKLKVTNSSECVSYDTVMCTSGEGNKGICHGDSGGPLSIYVNNINILVGVITAIRKGDCENGLPSIYVRVNKILDWIYHN